MTKRSINAAEVATVLDHILAESGRPRLKRCTRVLRPYLKSWAVGHEELRPPSVFRRTGTSTTPMRGETLLRKQFSNINGIFKIGLTQGATIYIAPGAEYNAIRSDHGTKALKL